MPESQGEADDGNGSTKIEAAESIPSYSVSGREEREWTESRATATHYLKDSVISIILNFAREHQRKK